MNLRAITDGYCRNIDHLKTQLTQLASKAASLSDEVEDKKQSREAAESNVEALRRTQAAKTSELETVKAEFGEAQLENSTNEMQTLRKRYKTLRDELKALASEIENAGDLEPGNDLAVRCAALQVEKEALRKRLPAVQLVPYVDALPELLRDVYEADRETAQNLTAWLNKITIPAIYDKATMQRARAGQVTPQQTDPAYQQRQATRRREWEAEKRKQNIKTNREAMTSGAAHTGLTPSSFDEEGRLTGDEIARILREKQAS